MNNAGIFSRIAVLCLIPLFLYSCNDDDLKTAAEISSKKLVLSKDRSLKVEIVFSDSAVVKAKGYAPVLDQVNPTSGSKYQEMPKGVKITFFDPLQTVTGTIVSDYALRKETEQITIFKRNVVVVRNDLTFNTEELTWDQKKKMFFSPRGIVTRPDGTVLNAINFSAPEDFSSVDFEQGSGETYVKGDLAP
ncbi:hypothetical protein SAMN06265348_103413 [Pedobacter westerhofensis]|uniref:LPS export ABC transporter protein LptC n=1 Tax=Pedobacter westerhofensis TaxID=425512 RepID=A0A521CBT1_9SPHI|nr:hypothetical protein [Pedobacter westerhofensis]SMO56858.1 hypothetical protein SAMN06265348_103413 [Pedobacter westerhofensis]